MHSTTRAPDDDFHLRVVVDRLVREGRSQSDIEAIVARLAPPVDAAPRRTPLTFIRRLVSA